MNRLEKEKVIESLKQDFASSQAAFLVGVQGLTIGQFESLRKSIRAQGGKLLVAKNTLLTVAAHGMPAAEILSPYFKDQVAIVFARTEPAAIARVLNTMAAEHERLQIVVGSFESRLLNKETVRFLATLPSREGLLAQLCGVLQAPVACLARVVKQASEKQQV